MEIHPAARKHGAADEDLVEVVHGAARHAARRPRCRVGGRVSRDEPSAVGVQRGIFAVACSHRDLYAYGTLRDPYAQARLSLTRGRKALAETYVLPAKARAAGARGTAFLVIADLKEMTGRVDLLDRHGRIVGFIPASRGRFECRGFTWGPLGRVRRPRAASVSG